MVLKVLGNWKYTPKFAGNKKMVIEFKRLNAVEEMEAVRDSTDTSVGMLESSIVSIENPLKLEDENGKQRDMVISDIATVPQLRELFFELTMEHSGKTKLTEDTAKKQG